jgi:hypothetical protein
LVAGGRRPRALLLGNVGAVESPNELREDNLERNYSVPLNITTDTGIPTLLAAEL